MQKETFHAMMIVMEINKNKLHFDFPILLYQNYDSHQPNVFIYQTNHKSGKTGVALLAWNYKLLTSVSITGLK